MGASVGVGMTVWQCRVFLVVILCHLALSSPAVRRDLRALGHEVPLDPVALAQPERLGEDTFGGAADPRGDREKRLLKTTAVVTGVKAVATKAVAAGVKAIGAKVLKSSVGVSAGAVGLKAAAGKAIGAKVIGAKVKAVGVKAVGAVAALGLKALLLKLLFGNINKILTQKEKMLNQLDHYNKVQNIKFSQQLFPHAPCKYPQGAPSGYPQVAPGYQGAPAGYPAPTVAPAVPAYSPLPLPEEGLQQPQGYVYRRRRR